MGRLVALLFLVGVALVALALISCLSAEPKEIRTMPRLAWLFVILLFPLAGPLAWFLAGRPVSGGSHAGPGRGRPGSRGRRRPVAPDDDPDFLRSLDADQARQEREMLDRWEEDLRRPDDDDPR